MRAFTILAFDDIIEGTATAWYTSATFDDQLGSADGLGLQTITTDVSGVSPTLTCQVQTSADGKHWVDAGSPQISAQPMSNDISDQGTLERFDPLIAVVHVRPLPREFSLNEDGKVV